MTGRSAIKRKAVAFIDSLPEWAVGPHFNFTLRKNAGIPEKLSSQMYRDELAAAEAVHLAKTA